MTTAIDLARKWITLFCTTVDTCHCLGGALLNSVGEAPNRSFPHDNQLTRPQPKPLRVDRGLLGELYKEHTTSVHR